MIYGSDMFACLRHPSLNVSNRACVIRLLIEQLDINSSVPIELLDLAGVCISTVSLADLSCLCKMLLLVALNGHWQAGETIACQHENIFIVSYCADLAGE